MTNLRPQQMCLPITPRRKRDPDPRPGAIGYRLRGRCCLVASRLLLALLTISLFGLDNLRPIIGLSQPKRSPSQDEQANGSETRKAQDSRAAARIVILGARQDPRTQPCGHLWPGVLSERVAPADSIGRAPTAYGSGARPFGAVAFARVPSSCLIWARALHTTRPILQAGTLTCLSCGRQICPVGPPLA